MKQKNYDYTISVALVTRNRPDSLDRCLKSLRQQAVQPFEVIVSDDSDEAKEEQTQLIAEKWRCRYIKGPKRGLYANRNYVALACKGTHIRTMDDDHEFPKDHFKICYEAININSESIWIIGETYPDKVEPLVLPVPCPGQLHPRGFSTTPSNINNCWAISCGASIYPANVFKQGIFNVEFFKFGASFLEFGSRLNWLGYTIKYLEHTYIIHHYDKSSRSFANKEMELSSMFFAVFCHSFIYQKRLKNKVLTLLEVLKQLLIEPIIVINSLKSALHCFRVHKQNLQLHHNKSLFSH